MNIDLRVVSRLLGFAVLGLGLAQISAIPWGYYHDDHAILGRYVGAVLITLAAGGLSVALGRGGEIRRREALAVVATMWIAAGLFGGLPFVLTGAIPSPAGAFFEAVSGFTTTGATVIEDIDAQPLVVLYWRSMTQWLGGMGIIVLFLAVFPTLGVGSRHLFRFEVPGPITEGLQPKIRSTALTLWGLYALLTGVEFLLLVAADMSPFEAMNHAFTTMATGGFSTRGASVAAFDSAAIEWIITGFMALAGINFGLLFMVQQGKFKKALGSEELWFYLGILGFTTLVLFIQVRSPEGVGATLRDAAFTAVSLATTTGYVTADADTFPNFSRVLLLTIMVVGGMAGSTAGGTKVSRVMILLRAARHEIHRVFRPQAVFSMKMDGKKVDDRVVRGVLAFFFLAVLISVFAVLALSLYDAGSGSPNDRLVTHISAVIACLFNIGPGMASAGGTESFAFLPGSALTLLALLMILGRLEFYALLVLLLPGFWRR